MQQQYIIPDWPVADNIKSLLTTRQGGYSQPPWDSFNLAQHVNDNPLHIEKNRTLLRQQLPAEPFWLNQIHSQSIIEIDKFTSAKTNTPPDADGSFTMQPNQICSVLTADCLPLLICSENASAVAAVHAGWRGLAGGIIDNAINLLCNKTQLPAKHLMVWLGPAISKQYFEVGKEVRQQFIQRSSEYQPAFTLTPGDKNKYMADIYLLARINLHRLGVEKIYGGDFCSYAEKDKFYSYRRDGVTGRMASLIWKTK